MERRDFIKLLAGTGLGLAASQSPLKRLVQTRPLTPRVTAYQEAFKTAACGLCPAGCSINVRLFNDVAVGLRGNPLDPRTGGGLCSKGFSLLHQLYHPDRLKKPLKRSGPRGSGQWEVAEWDEAIEALARELGRLREETPESIVFLDGRPSSFMSLLAERWMDYLGSPNHIADHTVGAFPLATRYMLGKAFEAAYDLSDLSLVVSVGDTFLDYTVSPAFQTHQYARFRRGHPNQRGELIVFDDTRGITADKADQFHRIEPGTHAAILLALANVIVRYDWYDHGFVDRYTEGLLEWQTTVLNRYSPEAVEEMTGVASGVLYELASRLVQAERKAVLAGAAATTGPGGLHTAMAMLAVNALLGSIDRDLHLVQPVKELVRMPRLPSRADKTPERLDHERFPLAGDAPWALPDIVNARPDAVSALLLYHSNPLASHPGGGRWREALEQIPLVVSFSPFHDETTAHADWILPDSLVLERYQDFIHPAVSSMSSLSVTQPLWDEPLYDTRPTGDVLLDLIRAIDDGAEEHFPWSDYSELMEDLLAQIFALKSGALFMEPRELDAFKELASRGYWSGQTEDEDSFFEQLYQKGGWVQPIYLEGQWGRIFGDGTRRLQFVSSTVKGKVEAFLARQGKSLSDLGLGGVTETFHMPEFVPGVTRRPVGKIAWLVTWNTGSSSELPWWWEVVGMHHYVQWSMWAELGTDDRRAVSVDVSKRPSVRMVINGKEWELPAVMRFHGHPEVIVVPVGFGRAVERKTPLPDGFNILTAAGYRPDPLTGLPAYYFDLDAMELREV